MRSATRLLTHSRVWANRFVWSRRLLMRAFEQILFWKREPISRIGRLRGSTRRLCPVPLEGDPQKLGEPPAKPAWLRICPRRRRSGLQTTLADCSRSSPRPRPWQMAAITARRNRARGSARAGPCHARSQSRPAPSRPPMLQASGQRRRPENRIRVMRLDDYPKAGTTRRGKPCSDPGRKCRPVSRSNLAQAAERMHRLDVALAVSAPIVEARWELLRASCRSSQRSDAEQSRN
jgi:hypothetical protein